MPVLGGAASAASAMNEPGVYIPSGALDVWREARDGGGLAEVVFLGDSTMYGQTAGDTQNYPMTVRMRLRAVADGYADGGRGLLRLRNSDFPPYPFDYTDPASYADEPGPLVAAQSGFAATPGNIAMPYAWNSESPGDTVTLNVRTTRARLLWAEYPGTVGTFTVTVNNGASPVTYGGGGTAGQVRYALLTSAHGLTSGTDTITITNTASGGASTVSVQLELINDSGLVWHNMGNQGGQFYPGAADVTAGLSANRAQHIRRFGLEPVNSAGHMGALAKSTDPATPRCHAALTMYGVNDLNAVSQAADKGARLRQMEQDVAYFCDITRAVGCTAVVAIPFVQMAGNGHTDGANVRAAIYSVARSYPEVVVVDTNYALGAQRDRQTYQLGGDMHLRRAAYEAIGDLLWERVFSR